MIRVFFAFLSTVTLLTSGAALAGTASTQPVPEPGIFAIVALSAAGVIMASRLRKRK